MTLLHLIPEGSPLRPPEKPRRVGCFSSARSSWRMSVVRRLVFQLFVMGARTAVWMVTIEWADRSDIGDTAGGTEIRLIMFTALLGLSLFMLAEAVSHRNKIFDAIGCIAAETRVMNVMGVQFTYPTSTLTMPHRASAQHTAHHDASALSFHHETGVDMTAPHIVTLILLARNNRVDDGMKGSDFCAAVNTLVKKPVEEAVRASSSRAACADALGKFLKAADTLKCLKTGHMHDSMWQHAMVVVFIFFFVTPAHYALVFGWWSMLVTPAVGLILLGPMQLARVIRKPIQDQTGEDAAAFGYVTIEGDMFVGVVSRSGSLLGGIFSCFKGVLCSMLWCQRASYTRVETEATLDVEEGSNKTGRAPGRRRRRQ